MSGDMRPYVVRQGDYLVKLAFVHGFDAEEVWADAKNEEIRGRRADHNILAPGDIVYLPVKKKVGLPIAKGVTNKYTAKVPKVEVVLMFLNVDQPLANEPCEIRGLGESDPANPQRTDGDGKLTLRVPVMTREVSIYFTERKWLHYFYVGDMDPISQLSGIKKRLCNLGYLPGFSDGGADDEDGALRSAVADFQTKQGLEPTGEVDEATREAILKSHQK